jgi:hypothetical protein
MEVAPQGTAHCGPSARPRRVRVSRRQDARGDDRETPKLFARDYRTEPQ